MQTSDDQQAWQRAWRAWNQQADAFDTDRSVEQAHERIACLLADLYAWLQALEADAAHDLAHVQRVANTARRIGEAEGARFAVLMPAAWLHDCVALSKDHPQRHLASRQAASQAVAWLQQQAYPEAWLPKIAHAIEAHSFSAGIEPASLEAAVLRDADRLDALGAIGVARTLLVGGALNRPLYDPDDPWCRTRSPDDSRFSIDHFFTKLFTLEAGMLTAAGRAEARRRRAYMQDFLQQLGSEIGVPWQGEG